MSIYHRRFRALVTAFWITLLVAVWVNLAPIQAGGQTTYVIVAGNSMEPDFHYGDLAIVQKEIRYAVGDVVAYQNADINRYVIHRIIEVKNGRYRLQGDNNSWVDHYEPASQEILGKLWVHLPKFGISMQKLREPLFMALFAGLIGSLVAGTLFISKQQEKKNMEENSKQTELNIRKWLSTLSQKIGFKELKAKLRGNRFENLDIIPLDQKPEHKSSQRKNMAETFFLALAVIAFLSLMVGILSFSRATTQTVSDDVNYQHLGYFSYSAAAPAGVYDSTTILSGQPIFPSLTCIVSVTFNYSLVAASMENIGGSYQLTANLTHPQSGWQRTLPLQERSPFSGSVFNTQAELNLCEIVRLIESVEEITTARQGSYLLSITPQVQIAGLVEDRELKTTFEPTLSFLYDRTQFYLTGKGEGDVLNPSETNFLHAEKKIPNTVSLFGTELKVPVLRSIALIGFILSLSGLVFLGLQLEYISRNDQDTFIRLKYDPLVIDVAESDLRNNAYQINVSSIDDLAKLADKHNTMILHETQGKANNYFIHLDNISYVYSQSKNQHEFITKSMEIFRVDLQFALEKGELQVHYQPVISLVDGQIIAVEALLRWQHPQRGMLPAGEFIQVAETIGLIRELDDWVMQVACTQAKSWDEAGLDLKLAINLSGYTLEREPVELIQHILETTGLHPNLLQIEVPEEIMTGIKPRMLAQLQKLKGTGVQITIDDFVGKLELSSIGQMPISSLKLNRLLIKKINDPIELDAMQKMIAVATTLGLNVVGKGVETDKEKVFLTESGSQAQGFLLGQPVPAQEIVNLVQNSKKPATQKSGKKRAKSAKA